ncbi:head GIN domain-containing protein [Sporocytophaga myxococcoides]|uniref:head GIN domain-containing protein n=1 Tax=Sporocytophaga myxococcoides TaxID=153721 RepID=UPI00041B22FF|nr:head GIN domain-containing protein [Sporocytophaga myxococcoides]
MKLIKLTFRLFIILLFIQFSASCGRCKKGSGDIASIERSLPQFNGVEINGSFDVHIKKDSVQKVVITADDNILPIIDTEVENGILEIEIDDDECLRKSSKVDVYISIPSLRKVRLNGSGNVNGDGQFTGDEMDVSINGSGNISLNFNGENLKSKIDGSGNITLSGISYNSSHEINGSGRINAKNTESQKVNAKINGSGSISVNAIQTLKVNISGSGAVGYIGNPVTDVSVSGSGKVFKE